MKPIGNFCCLATLIGDGEEASTVMLVLLAALESPEDEVFLWMFFLMNKPVLRQPFTSLPRLDFDRLPRPAVELFRFDLNQLKKLCTVLRLPDVWITKHRFRTTSLEGLGILCRRLSYPNCWCDLTLLFGRNEAELREIFMEFLDFLYSRFQKMIKGIDWNRVENHLERFAQAIHQKGAPLETVIGFIDGNARKIYRPTRFQRCFSGHKRIHALKFQSIVTPDGLILHLFGPVEGRRHDKFCFANLILILYLMTKDVRDIIYMEIQLTFLEATCFVDSRDLG